MKKIIALVLIVTHLSMLTVSAEIGDTYPQAGMGQTTTNSIFSSLVSQFSGAGTVTQTSGVWRYQYTTPTAVNADAVYADMTYKNANNQLLANDSIGYPKFFSSYEWQPGNTYDAVITFIAPESGTVEISNANTDKKITTSSVGNANQYWLDGVRARIVHNTTQLWPDPGDETDLWMSVLPSVVQDTVYCNVEAGDKIYFRLNRNNFQDNDGTRWNPTVKYVDMLNFEKDVYYLSYTYDNSGNDFNLENTQSIPATVLEGFSGNVVYQSENADIIEPSDEQSGDWILKASGTTTISALLYNGDELVASAYATVNILNNNVGGLYDYSWNGAISQGPVWYYKAYLPATDEYIDYNQFEKHATYNFFTISNPAGNYGYIRTDNRMHPGVDGAPTLVFKAPRTGLVEVGALTGLYPQVIDSNTRDGIRYRICHNDTTVYPQEGGYATVSEINKQDDYDKLYVKVQKDDCIYFTLDKNQNNTGDMSAWSPTVTYLPVSFIPNPFELTDTVSVAPNSPVSDRGVNVYDTLQVASSEIEISAECASGNTSALTDATSPMELGEELIFNDNGTIDIIFGDGYTGRRSIKDLQIMLGSQTTNYSIDIYYSTTDDKETLKELYSAAEIRTRTYTGYQFIRLEDFNSCISDIYKLHIKINNNFNQVTRIAEIDINMDSESDSIALQRKQLQSTLKMPKIFTDNMMIQRDKPIRLWGYGGFEKVFVELLSDGSAVRSGYADVIDGKWNIEFDAMSGGHTVYTLNVTDADNSENTVQVDNILIGDVWLASGQSNMDFPMYKTDSYQYDLENAEYGEIRYFSQRTMGAMEPLEDSYYGTWTDGVGDAIKGYSAVAYQFARELYEQNNREIPIAIIAAKMSGTRIQAWMSEELLKSDSNFMAVNNLRNSNPYYNTSNSASFEQRACASFNAAINPILATNIKGVIWYQGEENAFQPVFYEKALVALINSWRDKFNASDMPFYIVGLPSYQPTATNARWPEMREVQLRVALSDENSGVTVNMDAGDKNDIHPTNKKTVGQRLAYLATVKAYGKDIEYSGPLYSHVTVDGDTVIVHFTHADGLKTQRRNPEYSYGTDSLEFIEIADGIVNGFELSSDGENFVSANAVISGNTVVVSGVENPSALRYGWFAFPEPELNLYNGSDLPAMPFRISSFADTQEAPSIVINDGVATLNGMLSNNSVLKIDTNVILAAYTLDGSLAEIKISPVSAVINDSSEYTLSINCPEGGTVKAFVWEEDTMTPLTRQ